jgi:RNA polymerase sigma-70 factor
MNASNKKKSVEDLFSILMHANAEMLTAFLHAAVFDAADIDDLFQETMLTAWRRLDDFDQSRPFGPWLRGIASKLVLAYIREHGRKPILVDAEILEILEKQIELIESRKGDTLDEKVSELHLCIERLPESFRQIIRSRYFDGIRHEDLSKQLSLSIDAVLKRLQRARFLLRDCLIQKQVFGSELRA